MKIIKSVGSKQTEIIQDILDLHNEGNPIDLDLTYSKGVFYKDGAVKEPKLKLDLTPQTEDTIQGSSNNTPFDSESMSCIMFDPPFVIAGKTYKTNDENSSRIAKRFSAYENYNQLKEHYASTLKECYRLLKDNGIVIMKLQNTVSSGKQHMTHYFTMQEAIKLGFYPKDEFVLLSKSKMTSFGGRWKTQQHAMKYHSYFMVFKKNKRKIDYDVQIQ